MKRRAAGGVVPAAGALVALGLLAACSPRDASSPGGPSGVAAAGATTARLMTDGTGASVSVPERATRVVALAPELAEIVSLLAASDVLVGRCDSCDRPASLDAVPSVGPIVQPSVEVILSLRPDLVLASSQGNPLESVGRLRELGITTFGVAPSAKGLAGVAEEIRIVGDVIGEAEAGAALAAKLESSLAAVRATTAARPRTRACILLWMDPLIVAGEGSFLDDLLDVAGADNACAVGGRLSVASTEYPRLSREDLLLARPDVIFLAMHEASLAALDGWGASIPAVGAGRVISLEPDLYLRPGPALADAAESLAEILKSQIPSAEASPAVPAAAPGS